IQRHQLSAEDMAEFSRHVAAEHKKNPNAEISLSGYISDKFYAGEKNMIVVPDLRGVAIQGEGNFWDEASAAEDEYLDVPPYLDLSGVDFSGSLMQGASFNGCNLANSIMCDADLNGAVFSNTKVGGLDLRGADLVGCEFSSSYDQVKHIPELSERLIGNIKLGMTSQLARRYADIKSPMLHQKENRQRKAAWKIVNDQRIEEWNQERDERVAAKQAEVNEAYKETTGYLASWVYNPSDEDQRYQQLQEELRAIEAETVPRKEMPDKEYVIHKSFQRVVGSDSTTFDPCYKRGSTPEERRAKTQYIETSRADVEAYLDELQQNPELTLNEFAKQKFIADGGEIADGTIVHADCSSELANLENDLNRKDFTGLNFTGANLQGTNFAGSDLSNCYFTGANISDASLEGALVSDAKFVNTKAQAANLFDANIQDAKFNRADFSRAYMSKSDATNAKIVNESNFDHAIIRDAKWDGVNIDNASFNDVDFSGVSLANAVVKKTQMRRANLEKSVLEGCKFVESDLRDASLEAARAHKAEFKKTILENVNAQNLDISEGLIDQYCNLEGADLEDAIMKDLRAQKVNFQGE
ncbi:pentapeptide repeat-containing protein, partial [Rickettsiaceae bacterium]|nr:pentapeptide repeat-containing protein [Rickettsiaceae bacterium]